MIRRLADMADTQFIATTFRPEIAKVADKIYGVTHKNRVSYINVVSKEQALDFIEHDQTHNASWGCCVLIVCASFYFSIRKHVVAMLVGAYTVPPFPLVQCKQVLTQKG